jgi:hypothetical protein
MHTASKLVLAGIWLVMGLGAKVLDLAPRHREIVARILGEDHADLLTVAIGMGEIGMAAWILSGRFPRLCAIAQIGLVGVMNFIEILLARDLLLFGAWNGLVALAFILFVALTQWPRTTPAP